MYYDRFSPPPASSSPPAYVDSSPPESPSQLRFTSHLPIDINTSPGHNFTDPLAGSQKAYHIPTDVDDDDFDELIGGSPLGKGGLKRAYGALQSGAEKSANEPRKHGRFNSQPVNFLSDEVVDPYTYQPQSAKKCEAIWVDIIARVVDPSREDRLRDEIDLTRHGLTHISVDIHDINKGADLGPKAEYTHASPRILTATAGNVAAAGTAKKPFGRVATAPSLSRVNKPLGRVVSQGSLPTDNQFSILLRHNSISSLPKELFSLKRLTILSLQGNILEYLPPQIGLLHNLRELNLSNNRLENLPAELNSLKLRSLSLSGNPCLKDLAVGAGSHHKATPTKSRPFPTAQRLSYPLPALVPSLAEICLRVLFSQSVTNAAIKQTNFRRHHALPLPVGEPPAWPISKHIAEDLVACFYDYDGSHPDQKCISDGSTVDSAPQPVRSRPTGISHCTSPKHQSPAGVYFRHHVEYIEWRTEIAGVSFGGCAPLLWRGCSPGCLDHLLPADLGDSEAEGWLDTPRKGALGDDEDEEMEMGVDEPPVFAPWSGRGGSLADAFDDGE